MIKLLSYRNSHKSHLNFTFRLYESNHFSHKSFLLLPYVWYKTSLFSNFFSYIILGVALARFFSLLIMTAYEWENSLYLVLFCLIIHLFLFLLFWLMHFLYFTFLVFSNFEVLHQWLLQIDGLYSAHRSRWVFGFIFVSALAS